MITLCNDRSGDNRDGVPRAALFELHIVSTYLNRVISANLNELNFNLFLANKAHELDSYTLTR